MLPVCVVLHLFIVTLPNLFLFLLPFTVLCHYHNTGVVKLEMCWCFYYMNQSYAGIKKSVLKDIIVLKYIMKYDFSHHSIMSWEVQILICSLNLPRLNVLSYLFSFLIIAYFFPHYCLCFFLDEFTQYQ